MHKPWTFNTTVTLPGSGQPKEINNTKIKACNHKEGTKIPRVTSRKLKASLAVVSIIKFSWIHCQESSKQQWCTWQRVRLYFPERTLQHFWFTQDHVDKNETRKLLEKCSVNGWNQHRYVWLEWEKLCLVITKHWIPAWEHYPISERWWLLYHDLNLLCCLWNRTACHSIIGRAINSKLHK